jgi:hypothetical protein
MGITVPKAGLIYVGLEVRFYKQSNKISCSMVAGGISISAREVQPL